MPELKPGFDLDRPPLGSAMYWRAGFNVRAHQGRMETIGLMVPMRTVGGALIVLPQVNTPPDAYRSILVCPSVIEGQVLAASVSRVQALTYDAASTIATGTRYKRTDITPTGLPAIDDSVARPSSGRTEVTPVWWWAEQTDAIYGMRAGVDEPVYRWDRTLAKMVAIATPHHAVAGGIVGSILVLLGADSFVIGGAPHQMTVRWSDRFNFETWAPSDINVSGEMQLEGGSQIMGGGVISQGIVVWTDKRMAMLTETGDPNSVFARRYVDGGRGLMTNRAWCEADGVLWWYDETRTLNQWSGGQPTQIVNPLRSGTIERAEDADMLRAYMVPNPKYGEIILWYSDPDETMWTGLVYNYLDQVWTVWRLDRPGWGSRSSAIRSVGVDSTGHLFQHDMPAPIPEAWTPYASATPTDIVPFDWSMTTNLIIPEQPLDKAQHVTQFLMDYIPAHSTSGSADTISVSVTGFADYRRQSMSFKETKAITDISPRADFRVEGKCLEITMGTLACTSLFRMGQIEAIIVSTANR